MQTYAFLLWREPLLSLAELGSLFSSVERRGDFAIIQATQSQIEECRNSLWWTIKIWEVLAEGLKKQDLLTTVIDRIARKTQEGKKLRVGIDTFIPALSSLVFKAKDSLKADGHSIRIVQHDNGRIKTATTIHEKLIEQGIELIIFPDKNGFTLAETMWIQDIESYSERDMDRDRSMVVGMMPPKIAQIMINLGTKWQKNTTIWDPFCGLGTTLIEALHAGYFSFIASDIALSMVESTKKNLEKQPLYNNGTVFLKTFVHDARKIDTYILPNPTTIVTEGMLGKNFTPATLTHTSALQERSLLSGLYREFFNSSYKNKEVETVACCLPFWNIWRETLFMPDAGDLASGWSLDPICVTGKRYLAHVRPGQCVGREIIVLSR